MISCAQYVMELKTSKRLLKKQAKDAALLSRLRTGQDITECDVNRLLNLHIDNIQKQHGKDVVTKIKKDAVYLFYKND